MSNIPPIQVRGSEEYWDAYELGERLDEAFPGQDAHDLCSAASNNGGFPFPDDSYIQWLYCKEFGERDDADWVWYVRASGTTWRAVGGCDFTGWDCQSNLDWEELPPVEVEKIVGGLIDVHSAAQAIRASI